MFANLCVIVPVVIILLAVVVVQCQDRASVKYSPDDNRIIKRLHGSLHAKVFLHGCDAEPYVRLNNTNSTTVSEKFYLKKATEYVFAIFTLDEVSIILSNEGEHSDDEVYTFNITLGIKKNSVAMLEVRYGNESIENETQDMVPMLPTIPYYVNVSITNHNISIYEARTGASKPFLYSNLTEYFPNTNVSVRFQHLSAIYAHYDCCEQCTPWIYSRISGCSKYSARTASPESETTYSLNDSQSPNSTDLFLFNQNIVVNHDGNPTFGAKIIFSDSENLRRSRYEIGLSGTPSIYHYVNKSTASYAQIRVVPLKQQYTWPFIVNITITRDGVVTLRIPHEEIPLLRYNVRRDSKLKPVDVKHMTMVKFHDDFIRYDFYYNCTDVLPLVDRIEPSTMEYEKEYDESTGHYNDTNSYPIIWEYLSKQFNEIKYDVLHIYHDSYQVYEKSIGATLEDSGEYDDEPASTADSAQSSRTNEEKKKNGGFSDLFKKAIVGTVSCLFMGIVKIVCSLDAVKNLLKEVEVDDEKVKGMTDKMKKVVVNENVISKTFGFGDDEE